MAQVKWFRRKSEKTSDEVVIPRNPAALEAIERAIIAGQEADQHLAEVREGTATVKRERIANHFGPIIYAGMKQQGRKEDT